jgi:recombination protein RecA
MGRGLRLLAGSLSRSKTAVIFINQLREKVGVYYGKKEITPGGKSLKFFSSVRLQVKKGKEINDLDGAIIGNTMIVQGVKNKVGYPWRTAEFDLYYAAGVDVVSDLLNEGIKSGAIERNGNTYSFQGEKLGVGEAGAKKGLNENEKVQNEIKKILTNKK